jgi:hypothetical protein
VCTELGDSGVCRSVPFFGFSRLSRISRRRMRRATSGYLYRYYCEYHESNCKARGDVLQSNKTVQGSNVPCRDQRIAVL